MKKYKINDRMCNHGNRNQTEWYLAMYVLYNYTSKYHCHYTNHIRNIFLNVKGISRDHSRDNALNFHEIRDFFILVMVLDI